MKIERLLTDEVVLAELGKRIAQRRLELQLTQAALAEQAGVSKRTVERIEAGTTVQISTMIRIFRALELLDKLDILVPEAGPRPIDLLKLKGKERQRATRKKKQPADEPWQWGDEA
ncbi:MAG: helix-turn-helix domain-containing protein [Desulfuromusa sp.]|jgi:transcriptional regulator with XRE-family HTH domain|nr:helix-turn-helix domain-containing protein [Desulfuromusa sp.]